MVSIEKIECSTEEIKSIVEELSMNVDDLDNVEILLACGSGGVCQTACQKGCQSCQPGNRYGYAKDTEDVVSEIDPDD